MKYLEDYIHTFCRRWNAYLGDAVEMRARIHVGPGHVAVEFYPADRTDPWDLEPRSGGWLDVVEKVTSNLEHAILVDGGRLFIVVHDDFIFVVKGGASELWTVEEARKDADASIWKRCVDTM